MTTKTRLRLADKTVSSVERAKYARYQVDVTKDQLPLTVRLTIAEANADAGRHTFHDSTNLTPDLFVSAIHEPTDDDHAWGSFSMAASKSVVIRTNDEQVAKADQRFTLFIAIHGFTEGDTRFTLSFEPNKETSDDTGNGKTNNSSDLNAGNEGFAQCLNCQHWIPKGSMMLHENHCKRNNVQCDKCGELLRRSDLSSHWHCNICSKHGDISESEKHHYLEHTPRTCSCAYEAQNLLELIKHRQTACPNKRVLCRYCKTFQAQGDPNNLTHGDRLAGITLHESYCGSRTIDCQQCGKAIQIKQVQIHAKVHEMQRTTRVLPPLCANVNCTRQSAPGNSLGLCSSCYGPLWSPTDDPDGSKRIQRVARIYLKQLTTGCGHLWCKNSRCATATTPRDPNAAAMELLPLVSSLNQPGKHSYYFCVDEQTTRRRFLAEMLDSAAEEVPYNNGMEWRIKAIEESREDLNAAKRWLEREAPRA